MILKIVKNTLKGILVIIRNYFTDLNISRKLMLLYLVIVFIPLLFLSIFFTYSLSDATIQSIKESYSGAQNQVINNTLNTLRKYSEINQLAYNNAVTMYVTTNFDTDIDAITEYKKNIEPLIKLSVSQQKDTFIKIFSINETIRFSGQFINDISLSGFDIEPKKIYNSNIKLNWLGITEGLKGKVLCVCTVVKNYYLFPNKHLGIFFLYFSEDVLYSLINKSNISSGFLYVIDDKNIIITSNVRTSVGKLLDPVLKKETLSKSVMTGKRFSLDGQDYLLMNKSFSDAEIGINNWNIIQLIPLQPIMKKQMQIWIINGVIGALCIFISFIIVIFFSRSLNKRIDLLILSMEKVSKGDTKVEIIRDGKDEIGYLYDNFNMMVVKLNELHTEVYQAELDARDANIRFNKAELKKKEAELLALQSQINPHYLFNTLESIRMNILVNGDKETANIIRLFADSFRNLIYDNSAFISVNEEMLNINNFLLIQKFRFGEKISISVNISPEVESIKIPKLLIQPLVENAIFHGLEVIHGQGKITIAIYVDNCRLNVLVSDNGIGMRKESLERLIYSIKSINAGIQNFALRNIYSRLKVLYGNNFLFEMKSEKNKGTTIRITIPVVL